MCLGVGGCERGRRVVCWCRASNITGASSRFGLQLDKAATLLAGKFRGGSFIFYFFFFTFIPVPLSPLSFSPVFISSAISSITFRLFLGGRGAGRHKITHRG